MTVKVRVVRDDGQEMSFGDNEWRIPSDGLENWATLPLSVSSTEIPSYDGGVIVSDRVKMQDRSVTATCRTANKDTLRARAISFFVKGHYYDVHLTYKGRTRWARGKLIGFKASEGNIYKPVEIAFTVLCPNPYLQSEDNFGRDIAQVSPRFGFPFMSLLEPTDGWNKGFIVGVYEFAQEVELKNDGDVASGIKAIIKAQGSVTNPMLKIGKGFIRIIDTLQQGDTLTLDATTRPPTVLLNGDNAMHLVDRESSILNMMVDVGDTTIRYDADDGYQNMSVSVYFNKQYAGV